MKKIDKAMIELESLMRMSNSRRDRLNALRTKAAKYGANSLTRDEEIEYRKLDDKVINFQRWAEENFDTLMGFYREHAAKLTITDSNGKVQESWHAHSAQPHIDENA